MTEIWNEQDFCQILSHFNKQIKMLTFVYIAHESQQKKCSHTATWVRPLYPIAHPLACCGMLLGVVAKITTPNIPFLP